MATSATRGECFSPRRRHFGLRYHHLLANTGTNTIIAVVAAVGEEMTVITNLKSLMIRRSHRCECFDFRCYTSWTYDFSVLVVYMQCGQCTRGCNVLSTQIRTLMNWLIKAGSGTLVLLTPTFRLIASRKDALWMRTTFTSRVWHVVKLDGLLKRCCIKSQ